MEQINTYTSKAALLRLGYVANLKTSCQELNALLDGATVTPEIVNLAVENHPIVRLNRYGYERGRNGELIAEDKVAYLYFETGLPNKNGEMIIGWFERKKPNDPFRGVTWGTKAELDQKIAIGCKFRIGGLCFDREDDGQKFLEDIAVSTIPETWSFKNRPSTTNYPILKSYIENTFEVLKHEATKGEVNKLVYSRDGRNLVFNTNLLDKYFHEVLIVVEVRKLREGGTMLVNPRRVKKDSELLKLGFEKGVKPAQPRFFKKVDEVIFQPTWTIDTDFDKFTHIIDERRSRFPQEMQHASSDELARKLDDAITFAVAIAQRNYKFIVPMYRPQTGNIQLLMPIYLKGTYSTKPDFALILTPDSENEYYTPETILPLEAVYQNARLIAKPDDTWLNPDTIL